MNYSADIDADELMDPWVPGEALQQQTQQAQQPLMDFAATMEAFQRQMLEMMEAQRRQTARHADPTDAVSDTAVDPAAATAGRNSCTCLSRTTRTCTRTCTCTCTCTRTCTHRNSAATQVGISSFHGRASKEVAGPPV
jgi:hypothetical protein